MNIVVVPSDDVLYAKTSFWSDTVFLSNALVEDEDDACLTATLTHEEGHLLHRWHHLMVTFVFCVFIIEISLLFIPAVLIVYLIVAYHFRWQEHIADLYVLASCGEQMTREFILDIIMKQKHIGRFLRLFVFHPSGEQRLRWLQVATGEIS